jgi:hypothetical protein
MDVHTYYLYMLHGWGPGGCLSALLACIRFSAPINFLHVSSGALQWVETALRARPARLCGLRPGWQGAHKRCAQGIYPATTNLRMEAPHLSDMHATRADDSLNAGSRQKYSEARSVHPH